LRNAPVRHKYQPVVAITPEMAKGNKKWAIAHWCASPTDDDVRALKQLHSSYHVHDTRVPFKKQTSFAANACFRR
jgi:hypothetical protein